jgi:hypothetical protein
VASADDVASCDVLASCDSPWACPEPPHPYEQLLLADWVWFALWLVAASFDASELAELLRDWVAELGPLVTSPVVIAIGTLALTPFCLAFAVESALWSVDAYCDRSCAWPEPPQPATQLELLDWSCVALWSVLAVFDADDVALLLLFCVAELGPVVTSPAAIAIGTLALTPVWSAFADELAL